MKAGKQEEGRGRILDRINKIYRIGRRTEF
jgi:hypothetical protein